MALPAALLAAVERHPCFTGCYRSESEIQVCMDPAQPLAPAVPVRCADCLSFHPASLVALLPLGMTSYALANALTAHVRALRGYRWATGGYHTAGGGFWLSAAYYGDGLFLVDASRNRNTRTDTEVLIEAFQHGVVQPDDPRMLDPALYTSQLAYVNMATPILSVRGKQDLLAAPQYSASPKQTYMRVSIVEFQPLVSAAAAGAMSSAGAAPAAAPAAAAAPASAAVSAAASMALASAATAPTSPPGAPPAAPAAAPRELEPGETCPRCGAVVMERPLFSGTFIGCLC